MSKFNLKTKYIFLSFIIFLIPLKGFAKITDEQKMLLEAKLTTLHLVHSLNQNLSQTQKKLI